MTTAHLFAYSYVAATMLCVCVVAAMLREAGTNIACELPTTPMYIELRGVHGALTHPKFGISF